MYKVKKFVIACLVLMLTGYGNQAMSKQVEENKPAEVNVQLKSYTERIHSSLPEYEFKVYGQIQGQMYQAKRIDVYKKGTNEVIQRITFDEIATPDGDYLGIFMEDTNFDGYKDLLIQKSLPAGPNVPYSYWTWDKTTEKFIPYNQLENIVSPEFDSQNKVITSSVRVSANTFSHLTYRYIDGQITLVKEIEKVGDMEKKVFHVTVKELDGNIMKIVETYDDPL